MEIFGEPWRWFLFTAGCATGILIIEALYRKLPLKLWESVRALIFRGSSTKPNTSSREPGYLEFRHRSTITLLQAAAICANRDPYDDSVQQERAVKV